MNKREKGNTYSTICSKLYAVRWFHRNSLGYDPGISASHAILLRGIRRFTDPAVKQQPLTVPLFHAIYRSLENVSTSESGGLVLAYFFSYIVTRSISIYWLETPQLYLTVGLYHIPLK